MNHTRDDAWLLALGAVVSDGGSIDWDHEEKRCTGEEQVLVRQLRSLAAIVNAQRATVGAPPSEPADEPSTPPTVTQWRHLLLFECIGAGAYGSVHRGWDPVLDREVAVKLQSNATLRTTSPLDEARHLARIRHSNVVVVHGAEADDEKSGIWMEYINGLTLAQIVRDRGPMSPREVTGTGLDLCSALSAIHAAGLLHRDIKAQNVMREVGGRIVLMDFSGTHAVAADDGRTMLSGTPLYMAPELFSGATATTATDVYSLGVLLFFLLSGRLPVEGATLDQVRTAHAAGRRLRLRDVRPDVPDWLVQVIEHATEPDPEHRFRTAGELEHALASASGSYSAIIAGQTRAARAVSRKASGRRVLTASAVLVLALVAVGAFVRWPSSAETAPVVARFAVAPPYMSGSWPRISPDGKLIVFGAFVDGRNRFWIRPLDNPFGYPILETTATETPFWSPDSRTLCYFADEKLNRIPVEGAEPQFLAAAPRPHGGDWSGDTILYSREGGIYRINASGGTPQQVTRVDSGRGDFEHGWPEFLPDGRRFLFVLRSVNTERSGVYVASIDGGAPWRLMPAYSRATYASGHLLYVRDGALMAHRFDPDSAELEGQPFTISGRVKYHAASDAAFDVSSSGVLIYSAPHSPPSTRLVLFDRRGRELQSLTDVGWYARPRFSPDGRRIVAEKTERNDSGSDLWVYGVQPRSAARLTHHSANDVSPVWSPDGLRVAFSTKRDEFYDVFVKTVDAVEGERLLFSAPGDNFVEHWSHDGRYVTATVLRSGLWLFRLDGSEQPRLIRAGQAPRTWQSEFSPDGRWLAYMSSESGKPEVYVEPFPATGARWQVSTHGGVEPHWSGDSKELLYLDPEGVITSIRPSGAAWNSSRTQALFAITVRDVAGANLFTVSPDGRLIVVNSFVADPLVPPVDVVVNWPMVVSR